MKVINCKKQIIDYKKLKKTKPFEKDCPSIVECDAIIKENGKTIMVVKTLDSFKNLFPYLNKVKYITDSRTSGMQTSSRTFGYKQRNVLRNDFCSAFSMMNEHQNVSAVLSNLTTEIENEYRNFDKEKYLSHKEWVDENVLDHWKINNGIFTSGIINKNNQLDYHKDNANLNDVWSNMIISQNGIGGGNLCLPEYGIKIAPRNGALVMFNGSEIVHGVSPIIKKVSNATRYTIVYYTVKQMQNCGTPSEEVKRIRKLKTERERKRI